MFMVYVVRTRCSVYMQLCQLFPVISSTPNRCGGGSDRADGKFSPLVQECKVIYPRVAFVSPCAFHI
jgi:hypothetical protein